jgi:DegV family protein with EDD domain
MPGYAIITDTDSSLPTDLAAQWGIRQVPITIHFGQETFQAVEEINDARLFKRIDREGRLPTTSAPSPGKFAQAYQDAFSAGAEAVICFTVSAGVSASYNAAMSAREMLPDRDITVVDSGSLSIAQGFVVLAAAEAARAGALKAEILDCAEDVRRRTHLFAALSTLKYLAMSGRVGHVAAGMANILNIKPILTIREGKLELLERVRTRTKAWERVLELCEGAVGSRSIERLAILHVDVPADARHFDELFCSRLRCPPGILTAELTPGLSVHSGKGLVGAVIVVGN